MLGSMVRGIGGAGKWLISIRSFDDVIERGATLLAFALIIGLCVGVVGILGWFGIITLLSVGFILTIIQWGWLWLLR
ncbi:MAG: hypothetical protein FJ319_08560 [SAR202 cluster bacterium]|nr:hypothetical protein [SAR202 cluster bacterium]